MRSVFLAFSFLALLFLSSCSKSEPFPTACVGDACNIESVSGTIEEGENLSLKGSAFGSHAGLDSIWFLGGKDGWIESAEVGTDPVTAPNTTRIYSSQGQGDEVTTSDKWSGEKSINLFLDPENLGTWASTWAYKNPDGFRKIYVSFWYKIDVLQFPIKYTTDGDPLWPQHKFIRITSDTYDGCAENIDPLRSNNESLSWGYRVTDEYNYDMVPAVSNAGNLGCGESLFLYEDSTAIGYTKESRDYLWTRLDRGGADDAGTDRYHFDFGEWNRIDVWMDHGTWDNSDGYVRIKIVKPTGPYAGSQIGMEYKNVMHLYSGSSCLRCFPAAERDSFVWYNLFGVTGVGDPDRPQIDPIVNNFIDDPYIQLGTEARIELGDKAKYKNCTKLEMQKPISWEDEKITVELNYGGSFSSGNGAFLFVIGEDGSASDGFPIVLK